MHPVTGINKRTKVIYIASPYTAGDVAENVHIQLEAAHKILDIGHCPVAPLLTHYLHIHRQRPHEDWMRMDMAMIPRVDALIRLTGESPGADREVELAIKYSVKVFWSWEALETWLRSNTES